MITHTTATLERRWSDISDPLEAALAYHQAGLCVIPLTGKRPALAEWKTFQQHRPNEEDIRTWHKKLPMTNLGIVCGEVSENLVAIDFDGAGGYPAFVAMFPGLIETFTVTTGGGVGKHVYLRVDNLPPTTRAMKTPIGHVELRSDGAYVVAPPSIHPDTNKHYLVEKELDILHVENLTEVVAWIESFNPTATQPRAWQPPRVLPAAAEAEINPEVIGAIAEALERKGAKPQREWLNVSCIFSERHNHGDRNPSFGFNTVSGYGYCYVCGSIRTKDVCERLGIEPHDYGGLMKPPDPPITRRISKAEREPAPPPPPNEKLTPLANIQLPTWLREYVDWASRVGNQTPEIFHLGTGIWMASIAIARRVFADARWGVRLYPNLYMMFVADTTFYRKTTAYKLGERILTAAIPHMLMPTPGSPERFQDALAGHAPSNFNQLPQEHQRTILESMKFAAQRGLFKDEIGGLFGAFKRDYMAGLKDFLLEVYDCPDFVAKETQAGLAVVRNAAPSILGVTTPAGLSSAISIADWDNGLLPRFALLTPEQDYFERPGQAQPEDPPTTIVAGLKALHESLPMPEKSGDGWQSAQALTMQVESWQACEDYSNLLRQQCDPRIDTPLDDRLKGIYGRMHVQAMKVAMICATLDWIESGSAESPHVTAEHWQTGKAVAEQWRVSAKRLLEQLDRSGSAKSERWVQDRVLEAFRQAEPTGLPLRAVYRRLNLKAKDARQTAEDLVKAGLLAETNIDGAEAYMVPGSNGDGHRPD